jgi:hypothetical protein
MSGSARIGYADHAGIIRIGGLDDSFHVSVLGLFRAGHPHLEIPLEAIRLEEISDLFSKCARLHIRGVAKLPLRAKAWAASRSESFWQRRWHD